MDAIGINDAGQIVAEGLNASGDPHAFLLTPTPEPPTIAILVSFALIIIFIRYYGVARGARGGAPLRREAESDKVLNMEVISTDQALFDSR